MKKKLILFSLLSVFLTSICWGQTATVTAFVQDPNAQAFANGTVTITFVPTPGVPGPFTVSGSPIQLNGSNYGGATTFPLDGSGSFTLTMSRNDFIQPANSKWQFVVCPNATAACTTVPLVIASANPSLSALINSQIPAITVVAGQGIPRAYNTSELIVTPNAGQNFWNVTIGTLSFWNGTTWVQLPTAGSSFLAPDGTCAAPGYSFTNGTNTGLIRTAGGALDTCVVGTPVSQTQTTGLLLENNGIFGWSSIANPNAPADTGISRTNPATFAFGNGTQADLTGILIGAQYRSFGSALALPATSVGLFNYDAIGGQLTLAAQSPTGLTSLALYTANGAGSLPRFGINSAGTSNFGLNVAGFSSGGALGAVDTGISRIAAGTFALGNGTNLDTSATIKYNVSLPADGSDAAPTYSFSAATTTGFWHPGTGNIAVVSSGVKRVNFGTNVSLISSTPLVWTTGDPFSTSSDTGISRTAAATIGFGNGTQGDTTATTTASTYGINGGTSSLDQNSGLTLGSGRPVRWGSTAAGQPASTVDSGISRVAAGIIGIGNGAAADFSGTIKATNVNAVTGYQINGSFGTNGQCYTTTGSATAFATCAGGLVAPQINIASTTVNAATTGIQNLQSITFAAGTFNVAGKTFTIRSNGSYVPSSAATNVNISANIGGVVFSLLNLTPGNTSTWGWAIGMDCTTASTGTNGGITCGLNAQTQQTSILTGQTPWVQGNFGAAGSGVNWTLALTIQITVTFSTSSTSNSATGGYLVGIPIN